MGSHSPNYQVCDELGQHENQAHLGKSPKNEKTAITSSVFISAKFGAKPLQWVRRCAAFQNGVGSPVSGDPSKTILLSSSPALKKIVSTHIGVQYVNHIHLVGQPIGCKPAIVPPPRRVSPETASNTMCHLPANQHNKNINQFSDGSRAPHST